MVHDSQAKELCCCKHQLYKAEDQHSSKRHSRSGQHEIAKKRKKKRIKIVLGTKDDGLSQFGIANKVNKNHAGTSQQKEDKEIDLEGK